MFYGCDLLRGSHRIRHGVGIGGRHVFCAIACLAALLFFCTSAGGVRGVSWLGPSAAAAQLEDDAESQLLDETKPTVPKLRPPTPEAQQASEQEVRTVFADDFSAANSASKKVALSKQLLEQSEKTAAVADQWALLKESLRLATESGNLTAAEQALDRLGAVFQIDSDSIWLEVLTKLAAKPTPDSLEEIARACIAFADHTATFANGSGANAGVLKSLALAAALARRSKNTALLAEVVQLQASLREREKESKETAALLAKLADSPNDPDVCLEAGKYFCFKLGDWGRGLPMLAKGSDTALSRLAVAEKATQPKPAAAVALADAWYQWAATDRGAHKAAAEQHACAIYEKHLGSVEGLERTRIEKRIAAVSAVAPNPSRPAKDGPKSIPGLIVWLDATAPLADAKGKPRGGSELSRLELWKDLSGSGNDARQPNANLQPKKLADSVQFDGTTFLTLARPLNATALTVFVVYRATAATTDTTMLSTRSASDAGWMIDHQIGNVWFRAFGMNSAAGQAVATPTAEPLRVFVASLADSGAIAVALNGQPTIPGTIAGGMAKSTVPLTIGAKTGNAGGGNFQGEIVRLVIHTRVLSALEVTALTAWSLKSVRR